MVEPFRMKSLCSVFCLGRIHEFTNLFNELVKTGMRSEKYTSDLVMERFGVVICPEQLIVLTNNINPKTIYPGQFKVLVHYQQIFVIHLTFHNEKRVLNIV